MKITNNKKEIKEINKFLECKYYNMQISDMLLDFYSYIDAIDNALNEDEYLTKMYEFWQLDSSNSENTSVINSRINIEELDPRIVLNNPYYKNIKIPALNIGRYSLSEQKYFPYQGFARDEINVDDNYYREISKVGYFKESITFPILKKDEDVWMSLNPNEIKTMGNDIKDASGDVLVCGLGLGYYPYMVSIKNDVRSVTIIENDENVINIFKQHILPQFECKEKINIIKDDALKYLAKQNKKYDYVFIDLWHDANDGLPLYIKLKKIENKNKENFHYWLETSLICLYRRYFLSIVEEAMLGYQDSDYFTDDEPILNELYFKTKKLAINSASDLHYYCQKEQLIKLMIQ